MTKLYNDPARFTEDALAGFLDAHAERVVGVDGGVVRATTTPPGKVAVVVGGGSGHYPAFCGVVGTGFADGAVVGNVFTSPSAREAESVARAAHGDAGVLLTTGNYAGDVMNFTLAVDHLRRDGIEAEYFAVTDDVASAPRGEETRRRGIAGDFTVFKCASAAAESGMDLAEVVRVARAANDATRTLGVAFDGCTMPGADTPLFSVRPGSMGVGLGIHGEPGIADKPMTSAAELAGLLVDGVLEDRPGVPPGRVAVILNGLGRTKYEELFAVWAEASKLLRERGYTVVEPEVGELVTSLDMAGCSLTVMWLDDELERFWRAAADAPAYRKGAVDRAGARRSARDAAAPAEVAAGGAGTEADEAGAAAGTDASSVLAELADLLAERENELGRIDAVAGDGDHGRGMAKGSAAAAAAAASVAAAGAGPASVLSAAGREWAARAGGTSGVLWGAMLEAFGGELGDAGTPRSHEVARAAAAALDAVLRLGGARPGDKTMVDALSPFVTEFERDVAGGTRWTTAWANAAQVAVRAAADTAALVPKIGRARPLAEKSVGTPDAGAVSLALCLETVGRHYQEGERR
ncbi:dihydroxyacetone kinase family protein [Tsukamurella sp. 1534]|uniref:dihydroxyacetone kinase family protein n=1 Tax=Tsukamurella sp. 1534 TaxID=1151061 RepID=UPI00031CEF88|nr:dihydroxyacetone kinase family protein [Tsukamurella sp. 1534]